LPVNLSKGEKVSLTKGKIGLDALRVGLGWDEQKKSMFSLKSRHQIDCDASIFLLDENGVLRDGKNIVYYGALSHKSGSVMHKGDNLTGEGAGDDETVFIHLSKVPAGISKILFIVNIYACDVRKQHFGMIKNAYIRIIDNATNEELVRYNLSDNYEGYTTLIVGEVYKNGSEWDFKALGEATRDVALQDIRDKLLVGNKLLT